MNKLHSRSAALLKGHDCRFFTSLQVVCYGIERNRPVLRGYCVSYLAHRSLSIYEIDNFIGI
jgi:hypothetical protein